MYASRVIVRVPKVGLSGVKTPTKLLTDIQSRLERYDGNNLTVFADAGGLVFRVPALGNSKAAARAEAFRVARSVEAMVEKTGGRIEIEPPLKARG